MILLAHILIALFSVAWSLYTYLSPSASKLRVSTGLITVTLATGTVLIFSLQTSLVKSCLSGLIFISFSFAALVISRQKLAKITESVDQ